MYHIDAHSFYKIEKHNCKILDRDELIAESFGKSFYDTEEIDEGSDLYWHLIGLIGLWKNGSKKTVKKVAYSKDTWTMENDENSEVSMKFILEKKENEFDGNDGDLSLVKIYPNKKDDSSTQQTEPSMVLRVERIDYIEDKHEYIELLSLPIGYHCRGVILDNVNDKLHRDGDGLNDIFAGYHKFVLAITASKFTKNNNHPPSYNTKKEQKLQQVLNLHLDSDNIGTRNSGFGNIKDDNDDDDDDYLLMRKTIEVELIHKLEAKEKTGNDKKTIAGDDKKEEKKSEKVSMIRKKTCTSDERFVFEHEIEIIFAIDVLRGICLVRKFTRNNNYDFPGDEFDNNVNYINEIEFPFNIEDSIRIELNDEQIYALFVDSHDFVFVKTNYRKNQSQMRYFERDTNIKLTSRYNRENKQTPVRIIRSYLDNKNGGSPFDDDDDFNSRDRMRQLVSVILIVFEDGNRENVKQVFHFNLLSEYQVSDENLAHEFDVSGTCYLNANLNDINKRTFAYLNVEYELSSDSLEMLASRGESSLISGLRQRQKSLGVDNSYFNFINNPRIEFNFNIDSNVLVCKMLVIDIPNKYKMHKLDGYQLKQSGNDEICADSDQCSQICQMHSCFAFSYCEENTKLCRYILIDEDKKVFSGANKSMNQTMNLNDDFSLPVEPMTGCSLYTTDVDIEKKQSEVKKQQRKSFFGRPNFGLKEIISTLSATSAVAETKIPQPPKELLVPQPLSGLSVDEYEQLKAEYFAKLEQLLMDNQSLDILSSELSFAPSGEGGLLMLPAKVEFDFSDLTNPNSDENSQLDEAIANFRVDESLAKTRIIVDNNYNEHNATKVGKALSFRQCALACLDAATGVGGADSSCSSFSYCADKSCVLTNVYQVDLFAQQASGSSAANGSGNARGIRDENCFVAQRNYLKQFDEFDDTVKPEVDGNTFMVTVKSEAECAHLCVSAPNCVSIHTCQQQTTTGEFECYLSASKEFAFYDNSSPKEKTKTKCKFFPRSFISDFVVLPRRELDRSSATGAKLSIVTIEDNINALECAKRCAYDSSDCTAFEFCQEFKKNSDTDESKNDKLDLSCSLVSGTGLNTHSSQLIIDKDGNVVDTSKILKLSDKCNFFALKPNADEAKYRRRFIDFDEMKRNEANKSTSYGLSTLKTFFLCLSIFLAAFLASFVLTSKLGDDNLRALLAMLKFW